MITLNDQGPPPGVLPGSPIGQVGAGVVNHGHNNLSTGIPIPRDAVVGDLVSVWFLSGGESDNSLAQNFWTWPRPIFLSGGKAGSGSASGHGAYLDHFWFRVEDGEPGSVMYLNWDFGGFEGHWIMRAICYHGHDTDNPITSYGDGWEGTSDITLAKSGAIRGPYASGLLEAAIGFNADTNLGTDVDGSGMLYDATEVSEGPLAMLVGWVDIGYPYDWGVPDGAVTTFHQGSTPAVPGAGCGWGIAINAMPKPGPIQFGLSDDSGSPVGTYMDATKLRAGWTYTPRAGQGPQIAWLIAREHPDGSEPGFWDDTLAQWVDSPFYNVDDLDTFAWPEGAWENDLATWRVYGAIIEGEQELHSDLSAGWTFIARAAPVVTVTAPYGNVAGPAPVNWTVDQVGTAYQVRIFDSAAYQAEGFDPGTTASPAAESGVVSSAATTWTPAGLRGGSYYRAYVRVQKDNQWSGWAFAPFFAAYDQPATPTLAAVSDLDPVTGAPRVKLTVTGRDVVGGGLDGTTYASVYRYDAPTQTMVPVRFGQGVALPWPGQVVVLYDYEAPPNPPVDRPTFYQAQVYSTRPAKALTLDDPVLGQLDTATNPLG